MFETIIMSVTLLISAVGIPSRVLGSVPFRVTAIVLVVMLSGLAVPAIADRSVQASSCSTAFPGSLATTPQDPGEPIGQRCFDFSPYLPDEVTLRGCHECTVWWDPSWNIFRGRVSLVLHCVEVDTGSKSRIHVEDHCWAGWFC